jgi:hypothetical protein
VPVILISGTLGEEEAVKWLHIGATDYLLKERLHRLVPAVPAGHSGDCVRHRETERRLHLGRQRAWKGATFNVYLPCANDDAEVEKHAVNEDMAVGTETVLVVEDEEAVRLLTRRCWRRIAAEAVHGRYPESKGSRGTRSATERPRPRGRQKHP